MLSLHPPFKVQPPDSFPISACCSLSYTHRTTEWLRLEGTSGDHLVQSTCSSRVIYSWLPRTVSRQFFNISKNSDSTTSLGKPVSVLSPPHRKWITG